jgi:hypothetical protein
METDYCKVPLYKPLTCMHISFVQDVSIEWINVPYDFVLHKFTLLG